jgi:hypothetical protein
MREITWHSILIIAVCAVLVCSPASGTTITRHVELTLSPDQISDDGSFGSGVFWRATFPLEPFILTGPGDTVTVTVSLSPGNRVIVFAGAVEQESVFSLIGFPGGQNTFSDASWEFLGTEGELFTPSLTDRSESSGGGIAANFNPVDLTDSFYSFSGISFSFTILDDPHLAGLPATFDGGIVAVQTQGEVVLDVNGLDVLIDIKPGSVLNSINPRSRGVIPVAILTTEDFDATTVDPLSVEFGTSGATEAHNRGHIEDVDGDGDDDMVLHFRTQETGIQCGDTEAGLTGETVDGTPFEGSDGIVTVGC